jgi:hypothetical protein
LRCDEPARFERAMAALAGAIEIGAEPPPDAGPVIERIAETASGLELAS